VKGQKNEILTDKKADTQADLMFFIFYLPHIFLKQFLASRTNGTFAFAPTPKANASAKSKEPFFCPRYKDKQ